MKNLKKILAVAIAVMMTAALSVAIFADAIGTDGTVESTATSVTFKNVLNAWNPDETSIYAPAVSYDFSIAAASGTNVGQTITDENDVQAIVKAGVGTPTISDSSWAMDETLTAAAAGAENNKDITVDFSSVTFESAGVYRYVVSRTVTDTNNVVDEDDNDRFLDVYVKEESGVFSIYGYVLHDTTDDITTATEKSDGFYDDYKTSNLVVSKDLVNDTPNNEHQFPFSVTFADTKEAHIKVAAQNNATVADMAAGATTSAPTIADQSSVKYIGIPNGFTASVYETNNVTGTTYKSEGAADNAAGVQNITWAEGSNQSKTASTNAATDTTKEVAFTNTLELISPTGVIVRVAPFALILLAGVVLFVIVRRRKVED
ncbi:MAG: hypothetical protein IJM71_00685 [Clostridia bacterium]|nr:hypothetical protein [Clostridia bacterium]